MQNYVLTMKNLMNRVTYLLQGDFLSLAWRHSWNHNLIGWSCRWNIFNWKLPKVTMILKEIIGNDPVTDTLPWGGMAIVWSGGTTEDVPRLTGSVVCPGTSTGSAGGGEGASCGWGTGRGGEGATWIGDAGWGGEDGVVFCRFGWVLVLFWPFLFGGAWLGWGASTPDAWMLLVFANAPVCCY